MGFPSGPDGDVQAGRSRDPDFMLSLARGLSVLRAFGQGRTEMTIGDLARETVWEWFQWLSERVAEREREANPVPAHVAHRDWP